MLPLWRLLSWYIRHRLQPSCREKPTWYRETITLYSYAWFSPSYTDFCGIYSSLYTCASKGLTGGCCEDNCTVSSPSGTCCSCDVDCFVRGDCCSDISTIECEWLYTIDYRFIFFIGSCINTCESHGFLGCCSQGPNYCHTNCPNFCFCDEYCHYRGDCCSDIEDVNCRSPLTRK